jgi:serpin B
MLRVRNLPHAEHEVYGGYTNSCRSPYQLDTANALWGQQGYHFLPDFLGLTRDCYGAGLNEVDFANASETARRTINAWVEAQTHDRIKELLKPPMVPPVTSLILTNAVYFKGDWAVAFPPERTREGPFHVAADRAVDVPLMHLTGTFRHHDGGTFQVLELPYRGGQEAEEVPGVGGELSMLIALPKAVDGLAELEMALTAERLAGWRPWSWGEVVVTLPRFRATQEFDLKDALSHLGMAGAFEPGADFSGMTGRRDLFISAVIHKAFVDVNEQGTEAAAATAAAVFYGLPPPPTVFCADRPFLYLIRHNPSGAILFLGRLVSPERV